MKRFLRLLGVSSLALCVIPIDSEAAPVPVASGEFDASTYLIFQADGITWGQAREFASTYECPPGQSGHLATLTRPEEDAFVETLRQTTSLREVWIGGSQAADGAEPGGGWVWENGEGPIPGSNSDPGVGYRNWQDGEPNNQGGNEEHLAIGLNDNPGWNDEGNLGNIDGFVVECDSLNNNGAVVFPPDPDTEVTAIVQEIVQPGTITQTSCVVQRPGPALFPIRLDLIELIRNTETEACQALEAELDDLAADLGMPLQAELLSYQQPFLSFTDKETGEVIANDGRFVVTLIRSLDADGNPADITNGVVLAEGKETLGLDGEPPCDTRFVSDSPTTVGVNLSLAEPNGPGARNLTATCNRARNALRFSDHLLAYPIRNVSLRLPPRLQVLREGQDLRQAIDSYRGCVDDGFLDQLQGEVDVALINSLSFRRARIDLGIGQLQRATELALNIGDFDPYRNPRNPDGTLCPNDPKGQLGSRLLDLAFQVHRGLRYPWRYVLYEIPDEILCLLPPFPGETLPAMCPTADSRLPYQQP